MTEAKRNPPPREQGPVVIHLNLARTAAREYLDDVVEAPTDKPQLDPSEADYRAANTMDNCGGCRNATFAEAPEPNGMCKVVEGPIRRAFVCDRFTAIAPTGNGR